MTQIVPVLPGLSNVVASGPQYGVKYTLLGPGGSRAVFNDATDQDFVGFLTNISGLDSPDLRESADDLIGDDGGVHGNFFHGRRPIVIEGQIINTPGPSHYYIATDQQLYTNLLTNPSWELNTTGNGGSATVTRVTTDFVSGTAAGESTHSAMTGTTSAHYYGASSAGGGGQGLGGSPVTGGATYSAMVSAKHTALSAGTVSSVAARIRWWDAAGASISDSVLQTQNTPTINTWYNLGGTAVAPSNAVYASVLAYYTVSASGGTLTYRSDAAMLVPGSTLPAYFDGDTKPTLLENQDFTAWQGTPHQSTSNYFSTKKCIFEATRVRNIRMTALQRATNALRGDAQLRWVPDGGVEQYLNLRRQQPLRIGGGFNKTFQAAMVAADPRIYATATQEARFVVNVDQTIDNNGSMRTPPVATIYGPTSGTMNTIEIHNHTTGEYIVFAPAYTLGVGQYIVVDFANKTVLRENGTNIYDQIVFASSTWFQVEPGDNIIAFHGAGTTTGTSMVLRWQDAWV